MYRKLLSIYSPVDDPTLLSLNKSLTQAKMLKKESIFSFISRIRTLAKDLNHNGQSLSESYLTLIAIQALDNHRYADLVNSFMTGTHKASNLTDLTTIVTSYNRLNNIEVGIEINAGKANAANSDNVSTAPSPPSTQQPTAKNASPIDKFASDGWTIDDFRTLMFKYKCGMCRKNDHIWTACDLFKNWKIDKKDSHPRPNENDNSNNDDTSNATEKNKVENKNNPTKQKKAGSTSHVSYDSFPQVIPLYNIEDDPQVIESTNPFAPLASDDESVNEFNSDPESILTDKVGSVAHTTHVIEFDTNSSPTVICVFDEYIRHHMTSEREHFLSVRPFQHTWIGVGNHILEVEGEGDVICLLHDKLVYLKNVLLVSELRWPRFSLTTHLEYEGCSYQKMSMVNILFSKTSPLTLKTTSHQSPFMTLLHPTSIIHILNV